MNAEMDTYFKKPVEINRGFGTGKLLIIKSYWVFLLKKTTEQRFFIAFAIKENRIRLRANKVAVLCYFCFLGYIFAKGRLISESFSLWLKCQKKVPNHYPEH